jgi:hypothetical protein
MSILLAIDDCGLTGGLRSRPVSTERCCPSTTAASRGADVAATLHWTRPSCAGDAVCIDGLAPHYSEANRLTPPAAPRG